MLEGYRTQEGSTLGEMQILKCRFLNGRTLSIRYNEHIVVRVHIPSDCGSEIGHVASMSDSFAALETTYSEGTTMALRCTFSLPSSSISEPSTILWHSSSVTISFRRYPRTTQTSMSPFFPLTPSMISFLSEAMPRWPSTLASAPRFSLRYSVTRCNWSTKRRISASCKMFLPPSTSFASGTKIL